MLPFAISASVVDIYQKEGGGEMPQAVFDYHYGLEAEQ